MMYPNFTNRLLHRQWVKDFCQLQCWNSVIICQIQQEVIHLVFSFPRLLSGNRRVGQGSTAQVLHSPRDPDCSLFFIICSFRLFCSKKENKNYLVKIPAFGFRSKLHEISVSQKVKWTRKPFCWLCSTECCCLKVIIHLSIMSLRYQLSGTRLTVPSNRMSFGTT